MRERAPFGDDDRPPREECGVFAVFGHPEAAAHAALGLHALQHRGQEAAGIATFDGTHFHQHKALGLVGDSFSTPAVIQGLPGHAAVGHTRYATCGGSWLRNVQPLFADFAFGGFALAHNGNLTNALGLRQQLVEEGSIFQSTSDTEVIVHLIARSRKDTILGRLVTRCARSRAPGRWSGCSTTASSACATPGRAPLVLGRLDDAYVLASETCALDILGADYVRDVEPGEVVVIDGAGVHSSRPFPPARRRFCVFEYVYFARPDSVVEGRGVYDVRKRIGVELARETAVPADVVVPVPDSGVPAAIGYAQESGLPFELGIIRNHYVGRTFIEPGASIRHLGVKLKHNANRPTLEGRRVVLVDDSIVRGTTSTKIVGMVRAAGAAEVHMRIACPPTTHSCFYGVDTPERGDLLAANHSVAEMARLIGVDSLAFVSIDGLYRAAGEASRASPAPQFCDACLTGDYPTRLADVENRAGQDHQLSLMLQEA
jgi:amidophosphoribosyltransferase